MQNDFPEWYWTRGLHDAKIISVEKKESELDSLDKSLVLKIDCDGAMFENRITEIRFKRIKIKPSNFDIDLLNGGWWLYDKLSVEGNHYLLDLKFDTKECEEKRVEFVFECAEVIKSTV
jgi:hypothetical protein